MFSLLVSVVVLSALTLCALALIWALLPQRFRRSPKDLLRRVLGEVRLSLGRWELSDVEDAVVDKVQKAAQVSLQTGYLANRIGVDIAPTDADRFDPLLANLGEGITQRILELDGRAPQNLPAARFRLLGEVQVSVRRAVGVLPGTVNVRTRIVTETLVASSASPDARITPVVGRAATRAWLLNTPDGIREIRGRTTVGRAASSAIVLSDPHASDRHALIDVVEDGLKLTDLKSTNGTTVNGKAVRGSRVLRVGDIVSFAGAKGLRVARDTATEPLRPSSVQGQ